MNRKGLRYLKVGIVEFLDDHQPGFVACEFEDTSGRVHRIEDKVPIFTVEMLDRNSRYPRPGTAGCEVLSTSTDEEGRRIVEITIQKPDLLESTTGEYTFFVFESQLNMSWSES